jgi:dTDP-4-dehydrorhamnose reductase
MKRHHYLEMLKLTFVMESNVMKILVTGYTGQLGYDVVHYGLKKDLNMVGIGSADLNITKEDDVNNYIKLIKPDAIIHCAAYTSVDKAEDDRNSCWNVNVEGTKYLAKAASEIGAKFLYISTDYVFDGEGQSPFKEMDNSRPIGYYGLTKQKGEEVVKQLIDKWFILRISWVFGTNGNNFIKTMLKLAETRNEINVVGDQIGSPTYTVDLARLIIDMIQSDNYGIYHASNEGYCSWAEFAREIFRHTSRDVIINSISTKDYPTRALRPKNSRLSKQKILDKGFRPLPAWQDAVERYVKELINEVI